MTHTRGVDQFDTHDLPLGKYPVERPSQPKSKPAKVPARQIYSIGKYTVTVNQMPDGRAQVFIDTDDTSTVNYMNAGDVDSFVARNTK